MSPIKVEQKPTAPAGCYEIMVDGKRVGGISGITDLVGLGGLFRMYEDPSREAEWKKVLKDEGFASLVAAVSAAWGETDYAKALKEHILSSR